MLVRKTWLIENQTREALIRLQQDTTKAAAIIVAHHGHNSSMGAMYRRFENEMPDAIIVCAQGVLTPANDDPKGIGAGWQRSIGEVNIHTKVVDQDLKLFEAIVKTCVEEYKGDAAKVFPFGWSNGGSFVYNVLWPKYGAMIAGLAVTSTMLRSAEGYKQIPVFHAAGTGDTKVPYNAQKKTRDKLLAAFGDDETNTQWAKGVNGISGLRYASGKAPVTFLGYNGPHKFPDTVTPFISKFYKELF